MELLILKNGIPGGVGDSLVDLGHGEGVGPVHLLVLPLAGPLQLTGRGVHPILSVVRVTAPRGGDQTLGDPVQLFVPRQVLVDLEPVTILERRTAGRTRGS